MGKILSFLIADFLKSNTSLILVYTILNLLLYPINSIYIPRLYSELIGKVSNLKTKLKSTTANVDTNPFFMPSFQNLMNYSKLPIPNLIFFIIIISVIVSAMFRLKYYLYAIIFPKYKMWLREKLFSKTLEKRNTDFEEQKVGKEIMRIEDIIFTMKEIFNFLIVDASELTLISILIIGYLYTLDGRIALYAFLQLVLIGILIYVAHHKIKETTLSKTKSYYDIADNIDNSFNNLSNVLINNQTQKEVKKNHKHSKVYRKDSVKSNHVLNNLSIIIRILTLVFFSLILLQAYRQTIRGNITPTNFTTIVILLLHFQGYLYGQSWNLSSTIDRSWQIKFNDDYLIDLLEPDMKSKNLTDVITDGKIEFKNVNFQYKKSNTQVLKNLNLTIQPQEKVALLGKSGSGKSTLVKILIKLYKLPPNQGQILIDGVPHYDIETQYLRHKINYVNQNTLLFDEDIYYNIKYGNKIDNNYNFVAPATSSDNQASPPLPKQDNQASPLPKQDNQQDNHQEQIINKKIENILQKYDLLTIYDNLENGLKTYAGPKGTKLSLGMQKVTILMRGLMRQSQVLIFDEPLAGLDQKTREKVIKMITEETKNKTVIVITHDPEIIPYMDRSVNLKDIQN